MLDDVNIGSSTRVSVWSVLRHVKVRLETRRHVRAHVRLYGCQILELCKLVDDKDVMEVCVPKIRSISQELSTARGARIGANCGVWRCVGGLQVTRSLGFPYGGSRRTSMYLVLVGEASICANLKGGGAQIAWVVI